MNFCPLVHIWHKDKKGNKNKMKAKKWMMHAALQQHF